MSKTWILTTVGALALAASTLAGPVLAQDAPAGAQPAPAASTAEPSESHLAAARAVIDAIGSTDQFDNILLNAATQTKAEFIPNNPDRQSDISEMVDEKALELAPRRAALESEVARVYASRFSEQELQEIAAFYRTEAGKKFLEQGPLVARETMAAANVWSNGILRDLRQASIEGMNELFGSGAAGTAPAEGGEAPAASGQ